ncbi:MAG: UDP-N-acetylmuramate dehydrogenase [Bdellovibrionales bacterium]|nr:UDP-N-acetylmuramate dehydrogenase [Bdellovibrionales bacterium]
MDIQQNVSLSEWTSWKVGGPARFFCQPSHLEEFQQAFEWAQSQNLQKYFLGEGSNVLVSDHGVNGLVVQLGNFKKIESHLEDERLKVVCEAGAPKFEAMRVFLKHRLAPALFLSGLPGNIAGGVYMNAGVSEHRIPREFCEIVDWIEVLRPTGDVERVESKSIQWSYRKSLGWQPGMIYRVGLSWENKPMDDMPKLVREANKMRLSKQPLTQPSCGSVFRNPEGDSSGRLIESCGLKGYTVGGAQVSEKHANFIVNKGHATAKDIESIIGYVKKTVKEQTGFELHEEVIRMG